LRKIQFKLKLFGGANVIFQMGCTFSAKHYVAILLILWCLFLGLSRLA